MGQSASDHELFLSFFIMFSFHHSDTSSSWFLLSAFMGEDRPQSHSSLTHEQDPRILNHILESMKSMEIACVSVGNGQGWNRTLDSWVFWSSRPFGVTDLARAFLFKHMTVYLATCSALAIFQISFILKVSI